MDEKEPDLPDPLADVRARFAPGWPPSVMVGPGWRSLLIELDRKLVAARPGLRYTSIKEKYGRLWVLTTMGADPAIRTLIREAVAEALWTCELCGAPGDLMRNRWRWFKTLCEECAAADAARGWAVADA